MYTFNFTKYLGPARAGQLHKIKNMLDKGIHLWEKRDSYLTCVTGSVGPTMPLNGGCTNWMLTALGRCQSPHDLGGMCLMDALVFNS